MSHNHEHAHDEHTHTHGHEEHEHTDGEVEVTTHDGAVIASVGFVSRQPEERLSALMTEELSRFGRQIGALGGIIGHVKAAVTSRRVTTFSLTEPDTEPGVAALGCESTVQLAAIVFGVAEDALKTIAERAVSALR
ncbi:MAG: hypothetical protein LBS90_01575 [Oscillospiraceae bacterium]|jgi:hypothetical protein|nr:hypothetical protein [Oscillospiraceae bacterium]